MNPPARLPLSARDSIEIRELTLVFRPARSEDKPRVLGFTARTWDDGDYIVDVFDAWLADATGRFTAIELDGQVVAIGKLTDLGDGELWLEGLRVDPAHRQKGVGEALHNYHVDLAQRIGGRVLRYATGEDNVVSRMFGERTNFQHISSYRWSVADASTDFRPPERLTLNDLPMLRPCLDSPLMRSAHGLYQEAWKWRALSEARLKAHLEAGQVLGLRFESGLRAWSICSIEAGSEALPLHHLDGIDRSALVAMAQAMRRTAADASRKTIETFALEPSPLIGALGEAGYRVEDFTMIIFELQLKP
ncbi:MAG: GNAT family N-acetyltransferase [Anaerolineae bacterium]